MEISGAVGAATAVRAEAKQDLPEPTVLKSTHEEESIPVTFEGRGHHIVRLEKRKAMVRFTPDNNYYFTTKDKELAEAMESRGFVKVLK
jgi:hypothetical protein